MRPCGSRWLRRPCASSASSGPSATASGSASSPGASGIFGHGNVAGIGQALLQEELAASESGAVADLPYVLVRNEQAMVHTAVGFARQQDRLQTWACTASVGPGSTNMLTGAALATINRIPVLLLPSGTFATRVSAPVLQELEAPYAGDVTVNDAFRPLSRFFDEVDRPEQLPSALLVGDARAHRPRRDRRRDDLAAAGRAGGGVRLAGRALRRAGLARRPAPAGGVAHRRGGRGHPVRAQAARRRRRRRALLGGRGRARRLRLRHRHSRRRDAGRQGFAAARAPPARGGRRLDRHDGRQRAGGRGRRRHRRGHAVVRLHHRVADGLRATGVFASSTSTSPASTRASSPRSRSSPTPGRRCSP